MFVPAEERGMSSFVGRFKLSSSKTSFRPAQSSQDWILPPMRPVVLFFHVLIQLCIVSSEYNKKRDGYASGRRRAFPVRSIMSVSRQRRALLIVNVA